MPSVAWERLGGKAETLVNGKKRAHEEREGVSMTARTIMTAEVQEVQGVQGMGRWKKVRVVRQQQDGLGNVVDCLGRCDCSFTFFGCGGKGGITGRSRMRKRVYTKTRGQSVGTKASSMDEEQGGDGAKKDFG
jgi:hypothetical protein